eukprot:CAMPEP_0118913604 /NCGR_PEP_ID=MMETSP1166-20130328/14344_1 /TAXON_ID=1104430 /ORGANISM="Chrysoreinhardia sp, Strain CCMP3193" /LENGTH=297 /DNA_ID=CAMNT_0006853169 /DNA_START=423 /DNA_END=1316 /DNA_ORIENTATION=+
MPERQGDVALSEIAIRIHDGVGAIAPAEGDDRTDGFPPSATRGRVTEMRIRSIGRARCRIRWSPGHEFQAATYVGRPRRAGGLPSAELVVQALRQAARERPVAVFVREDRRVAVRLDARRRFDEIYPHVSQLTRYAATDDLDCGAPLPAALLFFQLGLFASRSFFAIASLGLFALLIREGGREAPQLSPSRPNERTNDERTNERPSERLAAAFRQSLPRPRSRQGDGHVFGVQSASRRRARFVLFFMDRGCGGARTASSSACGGESQSRTQPESSGEKAREAQSNANHHVGGRVREG